MQFPRRVLKVSEYFILPEVKCGDIQGFQPSVRTDVFRGPAPPSRPGEQFVCPEVSRAEDTIPRAPFRATVGPQRRLPLADEYNSDRQQGWQLVRDYRVRYHTQKWSSHIVDPKLICFTELVGALFFSHHYTTFRP
jgi:hypothetical protein